MIPENLQTPGNVTAATSALAAFFNVLPTVLGIIIGIMGVVWYGVLFYDRFVKKVPSATLDDKGIGL